MNKLQKVNLKDYTYDELEKFIIEIGEKRYRAEQIFKWLYKGISSIDDMTDLSIELRAKLSELSFVSSLSIVKKLKSEDGTVKYLFALYDDNIIESVLMKYKYGYVVCVSTQVGCKMGCNFCASTIGGLVRNLTSGEIMDQVLTIQGDISERISNIVLMGIGEPLNNYDNVIKFVKNVTSHMGLAIGSRHITISTCGIVPGILKLSEEGIPVMLSVSLHAPNDEIREKIMPVNKNYPISKLLDACKTYIKKTNKRITFEYAMIDGLNDTLDCAHELSQKLKGLICLVNLIPVNQTGNKEYKKSDEKRIIRFKDYLEKKGISTTVRRELGSDINASCGQLRSSFVTKNL